MAFHLGPISLPWFMPKIYDVGAFWMWWLVLWKLRCRVSFTKFQISDLKWHFEIFRIPLSLLWVGFPSYPPIGEIWNSTSMRQLLKNLRFPPTWIFKNENVCMQIFWQGEIFAKTTLLVDSPKIILCHNSHFFHKSSFFTHGNVHM